MSNGTPLVGTITKELVTGSMNIALTKAEISIQKLSDMEANLVYNEDNLKAIAQVIDLGKKGKKIVENEYELNKEPIRRQGQIIDECKRTMFAYIDSILNRPIEKYASLCREVEDRKRKADEDRQRKQSIQSGIDSNMVSFSTRIADCKINRELIEIERLVNLEKANKKKYEEFFDVAVEKYSTLTSLITLQKERVKEFERLAKEREEAEKAGNDEKLLIIHEQQVSLSEQIDEAKVTVQEAAINQSISTDAIEARETFPEVKAKLSRWVWEVQDIHKTVKSMPSWTKVETVDEKIDEFLKASKESFAASGKEEHIVNGIKFYLKKTY